MEAVARGRGERDKRERWRLNQSRNGQRMCTGNDGTGGVGGVPLIRGRFISQPDQPSTVAE